MDSRFRGNDHPAVVLAGAGTQANARLGITRKLRLHGVGCGCLGAAGGKITGLGDRDGNQQNKIRYRSRPAPADRHGGSFAPWTG